MEKTELIQKLKRIRAAHSDVKGVQARIQSATAKDTYERKVKVPKAPVEPRRVAKPKKEVTSLKSFAYYGVSYFESAIKRLGIAVIVEFVVWLAVRLGVENDGSEADAVQIGVANFFLVVLLLTVGAIGACVGINLYRWMKKRAEYPAYLEQVERDHQARMKKYNDSEERYAAYLAEKEEYDEIVSAAEREEEKIAAQLKKDLQVITDKMRESELKPALKRMEEENGGLINDSYYADLPQIIELLEMGRADSLKEALNLLAEIKHKENQLAMQRAQEEERRREREEALEREERRRQEDIAREERHREQERREQERRREQEAREKAKEESRNHQSAIAQCSMCANIHGCPNYAKSPNCPNFRHR